MQIVSINLSKPVEVIHRGRKILTGIYKKPVHHSVAANILGLSGDGQADLENHGGSDKAIYAYSYENYRYWEIDLKRPAFPYGQFGENLTVTGMLDDNVHIGDIFEIGAVRVQVTQPRVPCFKLGIKMEMPEFPKAFIKSGRTGFYLRVLEAGTIRLNDPLRLIEADSASLTVREAMLALIPGPRQQAVMKKALAIPALSDAWRSDLAKRIKH